MLLGGVFLMSYDIENRIYDQNLWIFSNELTNVMKPLILETNSNVYD